MSDGELYDVVIIGGGVAGAIVAKQLGLAGKSVLLLEAGQAIPASRSSLMERFFLDSQKYPEAPYGSNPNAPSATVKDLLSADWANGYLDQRDAAIPFGSTNQRRAGGTMWHWSGMVPRLLPSDFRLQTLYGRGADWPISYDDLALVDRGDGETYYERAEKEIGVSADAAQQSYPSAAPLRSGYHFPNPGIPLTRVDQYLQKGIGDLSFEGLPVRISPTPAGRNSRPYDNRRVCAGNTNCVPICPIEAKYDPTVTLHKAFNTGNLHALFQHVATRLVLDSASRRVTGVEYIRYSDPGRRSPESTGVVRGRRYVLASHAIESAKLLLLSGISNDNVGRNLMDHPFYLKWGLTAEPVYPFRGPLSTAGIETLRDGEFRKQRAAFRIEIGNEGFLLGIGDPGTTVTDFIEGTNKSLNNPANEKLFGAKLVKRLNSIYTRQCRIGYLLEQLPVAGNRVTLSASKDALGIPRPKIDYSFGDYENRSFAAADRLNVELFARTRITDRTGYRLVMGAGHIIGTCRMGNDPKTSVVDRQQRSWDYDNLFVIGSSVFPTSATANPSLTIAALSFWAADTIRQELP